VQLLQSAFRVSQCPWLAASQRFNVENCIRTLSEVGQFNKQNVRFFNIKITVFQQKTEELPYRSTWKAK
jgi:hypothetical protein